MSKSVRPFICIAGRVPVSPGDIIMMSIDHLLILILAGNALTDGFDVMIFNRKILSADLMGRLIPDDLCPH